MENSISSKQVEAFTKKKITGLLLQSKENKRILAELRRGIGKAPGDVPQLWGYFLETMPEEFYGNWEPSRAEWAVYTALTLFALHQQGKDPDLNPMQQEGQTIGSAISCLAQNVDERERISKRFHMIATSNDIEELSYHMRGMIQLLRKENIGLDYSKLAGDLYCFQFPKLVSGVRLRWGQDFYRNKKEENLEEKSEE